VEAAIQLFKEDSFIPVVRKVSGTIKALGSHLVDDDDDRDIETSNDEDNQIGS
jgi:RNase P/RNase MRP subunit POP5